MDRYQLRKARTIAGHLVLAAAVSDTPMSQLALLASRMSEREWISISLAVGVAVADHLARILTIALLGKLA